MDEITEDMFDEKKIKKAIQKGKRKTIITIVFVSIIVFVVLSIANFAISTYYSEKAYKQWDAYVRLTTPNGYISKTVDSNGIVGGQSHFKVSKDMKIKSIVTEQSQYYYGLKSASLISRGHGGSIGITGEDWQFTYKENGWRDMLFFHPDVTYKKYKNDEDLINRMEGDNIYEVALSFDKPYKWSDLPLYGLPEMTWFWLDTYNENQLQTMQEETKNHDWSSTFVREHRALGFSINTAIPSPNNFKGGYTNFLKLLQTSAYIDHEKAYSKMKDMKPEDVEVLGIVIYGTKSEVEEIIKKPLIKASSLGGVIDNY